MADEDEKVKEVVVAMHDHAGSDGNTTDREDPRLEVIKPGGQQAAYLVLSEEERAKGFVRPVRASYKHQKCGTVTTMGTALAETYARKPTFYSGTFCCGCGGHFPVGEQGEFTWEPDGSKVGT